MLSYHFKADEVDLNEHIQDCDLLIGGVLVPGANAPKLVLKEMISSMKRGAVIVDVAIDQGGCVETSKPTTHAESNLYGWRCCSLLCSKHAWLRANDINSCIKCCNFAICTKACTRRV